MITRRAALALAIPVLLAPASCKRKHGAEAPDVTSTPDVAEEEPEPEPPAPVLLPVVVSVMPGALTLHGTKVAELSDGRPGDAQVFVATLATALEKRLDELDATLGEEGTGLPENVPIRIIAHAGVPAVTVTQVVAVLRGVTRPEIRLVVVRQGVKPSDPKGVALTSSPDDPGYEEKLAGAKQPPRLLVLAGLRDCELQVDDGKLMGIGGVPADPEESFDEEAFRKDLAAFREEHPDLDRAAVACYPEVSAGKLGRILAVLSEHYVVDLWQGI